ncbi:E3 SUMO-protein ligase ZBED1-like [Kryptolebias marmoratus]|nr:E3 SUMO-protein ligase ZBED1-like [Kryptolebias marmoratus]XP_017263817.1 E3 SUMO-protein ligase ZBED1-like [Kryptolebias marmoratus]XP_017263937.1 E3 SUMO-protein ligase ZBED1-like [Kryptolebias marmoratus]XP_017264397.1 E3 SUMO-protein ligase ZBED1-like [Kryptolebias marmoratus]XP_017269267.1 E3 SUMO-protein ligase ZBED1-like [Kryptolebias marmoratus]XP_017274452.1 E3 SUMO-protein ligase ZBED1-like [Kryptolebias marmoratus]XP_017278843.1 ras-related protein Rab-32a isoform X1 [Kryptolebi
MASSCRKLTPSTFKSDVWAHFAFLSKSGTQEVDKSKVVCKLCQRELKYCSNTTNLRNHLTRYHADALQKAQPVDSKQTQIDKSFISKLPSSSARAQKITKSVAVFICKDLRPYSVVENKGFKNMLKILEPRYAIPTRKYMTEVAVPSLYTEVKTDVLESLKSAERVALTCDGWTSRATDPYVTITSHFISDEWELVSNVLQTRPLHGSHTGSNIANLLTEAINEWGITGKVPAVVTDNAANMLAAVGLTDLLHVGCFAHVLNLASQAALKTPAVTRLLGRVRRISAFFHRSTLACHALKKNQKLLDLPQHKLLTDVSTRWNSALDMLERFLEQQPAVSAALLAPEVRKQEKDLCSLTEADITAAEDIAQALKSLKKATLVMSQESTPSLSVIAPLKERLLEDMQPSSSDSAVVKEMKIAMCRDLQKRYLGLKDELSIAAALDPRFKALLFLSDDDEREEVFTHLIALTKELATVKSSQQSGLMDEDREAIEQQGEPVDDPSGPSPKKARDSCALADLFGSAYTTPVAVSRTTDTKALDEVVRYKEVQPLPLSTNPLNWWREHEGEYPLLSCQAKRYLCIPGSSVPAERIFSTAGDIVTAQRSALKPEHVDQLLFLNKNLHVPT